tara:strand:- start:471 stop:692 length:222 start_codon:yes stop_codon:yes gene_type:complete
MDWGPEPWQDGYMYGDFCTGEIWLTADNGQGQWEGELLLDTDTLLVGFGRGLEDELLLFTWGGTIFELDVYTS